MNVRGLLMYKVIVSFLVVLFFVGCSTQPKVIAPNQKVFEQEDLYILYALEAQNKGAYKVAAELFGNLYQKAGKKEYLYAEVKSYLAAKEYQKALTLIQNQQQYSTEFDPTLKRLEVLCYFHQKEYEKAKKTALDLIEHTKQSQDYLLLSDIYYAQKNYNMAVKYLDSAYRVKYDPKILDRMSVVLFVDLDKKKEAVAQLETHIRLFGCSKLLCARLASFYGKLDDVDGLLNVLKRLYKFEPNEHLATKIIQLYMYKKDFVALEHFLEESGANDDLLLQVYLNNKAYAKAAVLAKKLYHKTQNLDYLAQSAIYRFEANPNMPKKELLEVIAELKKSVESLDDPMYLNYLGYLMIEKDINIKEGMEYVKKALKIRPDSAFYLDSLAWGYYKLGKCHKAYKMFLKIKKLPQGDDPEVQNHIKKVQQCIKKRSKK